MEFGPLLWVAIWRRLVSKVAMKMVGKEMTQYLGDFQFGVGTPNGAEAVLHSANRFLNSLQSNGSLAMLSMDFSNAFNMVDRTTPSPGGSSSLPVYLSMGPVPLCPAG